MSEEVGRLEAVFTLNTTPLSRSLKQASSMLQAWAKRHDEDPEASVGLDLDPLQEGLKRASAMLKSFDGSTATAKLEIDTSEFRSELNKASRQLSNFDGRKAEATVTADTSDATRSFNSLRRQLSDLSRESGSLTVDANVRPARTEIQNLIRWAGSQSASVSIGADTSDARGAVNSLVRQVASRNASLSVGAVTQDALRSAEALRRRIASMSAAMRVTANTEPATSRIQALRASTRDMAAELRISVDQSLEDSRTKINEFLSWVREQRADLTVGAAVGEAQRAADLVALYIGRLNASIDVGANTALAVAEARMAAGRINGMSANIDVGADVSGAMGPLGTVRGAARSVETSDPTISVSERGVGGVLAKLFALDRAAARLSNRRVQLSFDQKLARAIPTLMGDSIQKLMSMRSVMSFISTTTLPVMMTAMAGLSAAITGAAGAALSLGQRLGAGLAGAIGSVGSAAVLGGGALGAYGFAMQRTLSYAFNLTTMLADQKQKIDDAGDAVKQAQAAVAAATPGTQKHAQAVRGLALAEQQASFEQRKFNAMLKFSTPQMMALNRAAGNLNIKFIELGAAIANKLAPTMTRWLQGSIGLLNKLQPHFVEMVGRMNNVADSFVRTMSKGQELKSLTTIMSGIKSAGVPAMQILTNSVRAFVNAFAVTVPSGLKVLNVLSRLTGAAARWTGTARGQRVMSEVWAHMTSNALKLMAVVVNLGAAFYGLMKALNASGTPDMLMNGLVGVSEQIRKNLSATGQWRQAITDFMVTAQPAMQAFWGVIKTVADQFFRTANAANSLKMPSGMPVMQAIFEALGRAAERFGGMLRKEFEILGPMLPSFIDNISKIAEVFFVAQAPLIITLRLLNGLMTVFTSLPQSVQQTIARISSFIITFGVIPGILGGVVSLMVGPLAAAFGLIGGTAGVLGTILTGLGGRFALVGGRLTAFSGAITRMVGVLRAGPMAILRALGNLLRGPVAAAFRILLSPVASLRAAFTAIGPVFARIGGAIGRVVPFFTRLRGVFARIVPLVARFVPWIARIALIGAVANPVGLVVTAITLLGTAFVMAYRRSERFRNIVNSVASTVRDVAVAAFRGLWNAIKPVVQWLGQAAMAVGRFIARLAVQRVRQYGAVLRFLWSMAKPVILWLGRAAVAVGKFIARLTVGAVRLFGRVLGAIWKAAQPVVNWIGRAAGAVGRFIARLAVGAVRLFGRVIGAIWRAAKPVVQWLGRAAVAAGRFITRLDGLAGVRLFGRLLRGIWNTAKPVVTWLGKAAASVGRFLARLAVKGLRLFVNGLRAIWNGARTLIKWIGQAANAVGRFVNRGRESAANLRGVWNRFWSGLRNLWNRSLTAIGNRLESWRDAFRSLVNRITGWVRDRWNSFWSGLKGLWDRSLRAVGNRTESWRDALRALMDRIARWVRGRWNSFWGGLKGLWDRSLRAVGNRTESWRDALRNLFDRIAKWARSRWDSFWSGMRGLWDRALSAIGDRARSWGNAIKNLFQRVKGWMTDPIEAARDTLKSVWNSILSGIGRVAKAVGLDKIAEGINGAKWAKGGTTEGGGGQAFANGGTTLRKFAAGGMGTSTRQPRMHLWNEQMGNEAYITERGDSRKQMKYLSTAASWHDAEVVPSGRTNGLPQSGFPMPPSGAERVATPKPLYQQPYAFGGVADIARAFAAGGFAAHVAEANREIASKFNLVRPPATYAGHGKYGAPYAADYWVTGYGNKATGAQKATGDRIASHIEQNGGRLSAESMIWYDQTITGSGRGSYNENNPYYRLRGMNLPYNTRAHFDHVHTQYTKSGKKGSGGLMSSGGGGFLASLWDTVGNAIWNRLVDRPYKNRVEKPLEGGFVGKQMVAGAGRKLVLDPLKEHFISEAGSSGSSGAGSPEQVKKWIRQGLPMGGAFSATDSNVNKMAGRAMQESTGNPNAVNRWDVNALRGTPSKGLFQIIEPTWNAHSNGIGSFDSNWNDPVKSTAVASRYMKSRYGRIMGASGSGYARGGVIPGLPGAPKSILAHAGERILPRDLNTGFESLSRSIDSWNSRGAAAPSVDVGGSNLESRLSNVESLLEDIRDNGLSTYERNWSEGERTMLASQKSKAGREVQRKNADAEYERKLARRR